MTDLPPAPLALQLDSAALKANWQWLAKASGSARCGAAIKANGYGLGAIEVLAHLKAAGCRDFFVATWAEAQEVLPHLDGASLGVFHGVRPEDMALAIGSPAIPVLNTLEQIARWKAANGGSCHVMIDTGMNRLGLDGHAFDPTLLADLQIDTMMSHLACADLDHPLNATQLALFRQVATQSQARSLSLANSAGILLGPDYACDLTRPGIALYGGVPRAEAAGHIAQVVRPRAQILQRRGVRAGHSVGYGATFVATTARETAILNIGYADGYLRGFSGTGAASLDGQRLPVLGRVSMDLIAIDVTSAPHLSEGEWLDLDYDLPTAAAQSGLSQYELLTAMGRRYERRWV